MRITALFILFSSFTLTLLGQQENRIQEKCLFENYNQIYTSPDHLLKFEFKMGELMLKERAHNKTRNQNIVKIPVVFHIIHTGEAIGNGKNLSDEQILTSLKSLNQAFARTEGTRGANTNSNGNFDYSELTRDAEIQFEMASIDPNGNPTNGIDRIKVDNEYLTPTNEFEGNRFKIEDNIKPATIWNPDYYYNVWVTELIGGILGYSTFPTFSGVDDIDNIGDLGSYGYPNHDGIVCDYRVVGTIEYGDDFNLYRNHKYNHTMIHETGHFLGLYHPWGEGGCDSDDYVDDTPNIDSPSFECDTLLSCDNIHQNENYMDYGPDVCKNIFTNDQIDRMQIVLSNSPRRLSLTTSPVLNGQSISEINKPENDNCLNAISISCGNTLISSNNNSSIEGIHSGIEGTSCSNQLAFQGVWFKVEGNGNEITINTNHDSTDFPTVIHVFTGSCNSLDCIGGFEEDPILFSNGNNTKLPFYAEENINYYIYISGNSGSTGTFGISLECSDLSFDTPISNDSYLAPILINDCNTSLIGQTNMSTVDAIVSGSCGAALNDYGVWYNFYADGDLININTCSDFSTSHAIGVFKISSGSSENKILECIGNDSNGADCEYGSSVTFVSEPNIEYMIWIGGPENGDFQLNINCSEAPDLPQNLYFTRQDQIDSFPLNYPNAKIVLGNLIIGDEYEYNNDIYDLSPLNNIIEVKGNLEIYNNDNSEFTSLYGLNNLSKIGRNLIILNDYLLKLDALSKLTSIGESLALLVSEIESFEPLSNLNPLTEQLYLGAIDANSKVKDFSAFDNVTSLKSLAISGFAGIEDFNFFNNLKSIEYYLELTYMHDYENLGLKKISGFSSLVQIKAFGLDIGSNMFIEDITGFESLEEIGDLYFYDNPSIQDINFLEKIPSILGDIYIVGNENLDDCSGICKLINSRTNPQLSIQIEDNDTHCSDLDALIEECSTMTNIEENTNSDQMSIFPNPFDDKLNLVSEDRNFIRVDLFDLQGNKILSKPIDNKLEIDTSDLPPAMYIIVLLDSNGTLTSKKIVKL